MTKDEFIEIQQSIINELLDIKNRIYEIEKNIMKHVMIERKWEFVETLNKLTKVHDELEKNCMSIECWAIPNDDI